MTENASTPLVVASWPGNRKAQNSFLGIFLDALETVDCQIVGADTVEEMADAVAAGPDILLLHWAERVFSESRSRWQALAKMRRLLTVVAKAPQRTRVVWVVHNLAPHDARPFQKLVWPCYVRALARRVDGFLTLSPGTVDQVRSLLPELADKPGCGIWHPIYPGAELSQEERAAARAELGFGSEDLVFGYCGQIRPYKGVEELLDTFLLTEAPNSRLLLAGKPLTHAPGSQEFLERLIRKSQTDRRVLLRFGQLSRPAYDKALGACDVVVAPFRKYLHSGSLVHALSAGRAVLTPATPFAISLRDALGADQVRIYDGELSAPLLRGQTKGSAAADLASLAASAVAGKAAAFLRDLQKS